MKTIKLKESDIHRMVKRVLNEQEEDKRENLNNKIARVAKYLIRNMDSNTLGLAGEEAPDLDQYSIWVHPAWVTQGYYELRKDMTDEQARGSILTMYRWAIKKKPILYNKKWQDEVSALVHDGMDSPYLPGGKNHKKSLMRGEDGKPNVRAWIDM
jgi:hypothetical protein